VEAVHKIIDPLFPDVLKAGFDAIRDTTGPMPYQRKGRYAKMKIVLDRDIVPVRYSLP
jgi:hypothetical protein